jgi:hypothetical protein
MRVSKEIKSKCDCQIIQKQEKLEKIEWATEA